MRNKTEVNQNVAECLNNDDVSENQRLFHISIFVVFSLSHTFCRVGSTYAAHINSKRKLKHEKVIVYLLCVRRLVFCIKSCTKCLAPLLNAEASLGLHFTVDENSKLPSGFSILVPFFIFLERNRLVRLVSLASSQL